MASDQSQGADFRLQEIGKAYTSTKLEYQGSGEYVARVKTPEHGWTAFFAELTYDGPDKVPFKFTTQVHILPDVLPHSFDEFRKSIKKGREK